jgi:hypothetical protein
MIAFFYVVISAAILCMFCGLYLVIRLRNFTKGGMVGRVVNILMALIILFTLGYLAGPFMPQLGHEWAMILTAVVFFFGAIFVVLVLRLIQKLIKQVFDELKM